MSKWALGLLLATAAPAAAAPPSTKVTKVVLYPDRAQVTRQATVECGARAMAEYAAVPPSADPQSFRAATNVGTIEGLRWEEQNRIDAFAPEVKTLEEQIRKLEREASVLRDQATRGREQRTLAERYTDVAVAMIAREMADAAPNPKAWDQAFDAALQTRLKSTTTTVDAGTKLREVEHKLGDLRRKHQRVAAAAQRREYRAEVLVSCPPGDKARVELTYLVGGASWEPAYEARADEGASVVEFGTFATVRQATGEDWNDAKITLSTAVPRQNATPPEIQRLQVWAEEKRPEKKVLVRRDELQRHAEESGGEATKGEAAAGRPMGVQAQGLSVQLVVPEAADVPGDGTPTRLSVGRYRMKAKFAFRTVPKMMPFVFRVADLDNQAPFPLLAGPLDAFRSTGMVARYPLARVAEGARFHLTFGIEEGLRVKREIREEIQRDKGFLGMTRRFRFAYRFEVANYTGRAEEVELSEHIPVSELDDVRVEIEPAGRTTAGYQHKAADGIVLWKLGLSKGEKKQVDLAFHVDVPSSYDTGNM